MTDGLVGEEQPALWDITTPGQVRLVTVQCCVWTRLANPQTQQTTARFAGHLSCLYRLTASSSGHARAPDVSFSPHFI
jgi:hypothetical protein